LTAGNLLIFHILYENVTPRKFDKIGNLLPGMSIRTRINRLMKKRESENLVDCPFNLSGNPVSFSDGVHMYENVSYREEVSITLLN
jgi:hypothetical protein